MSSSRKFSCGREKIFTRELNSNTHIAATIIFQKEVTKARVAWDNKEER
jgi:hypothetical protein